MKTSSLCFLIILLLPIFASANEELLTSVENDDYNQFISILVNDPSVDVNYQNDKGIDSLMLSVKNSNTRILKELLNRRALLNQRASAYEINGYTPIIFAVDKCDLNSFNLLIAAGANPHLVEHKAHRNTVHIAALSDCDINFMKRLIDFKVDINAKDKYGNLPLDFSHIKNNLELVKLFIENGARLDLNNFLLDIDNIDTAKLFIKLGQDVNGQTVYNTLSFTPLMAAASSGNYEIIELLVENGANINHMNDGASVLINQLIHAGNHGLGRHVIKLVKVLLDNGAELDNDVFNRTPLSLAIRTETIELVRLLLEYGADPNGIGTNQYCRCSPLKGTQGELRELLISYGAREVCI